MPKIGLAALVLLLMSSVLMAQPFEPSYDDPSRFMATEPVPLNTNPYLVPANRNPYFDDPPVHVEGAPTGNPDMLNNTYDPNTAPKNTPGTPDSGMNGISGGIGHAGTDGINGSGF